MSQRDAIENNLSMFAWAFDMDEISSIGDLFTEDAEVEFTFGVQVGREAILAAIDTLRAPYRPDALPWHVMSNVLVTDSTETGASVRTFFTFFVRRGEETPVLRSIGHYDDVFVDDGGTWRVKRRRVFSSGATRASG